ncbi:MULTISPECIES: hypothetical protein [Streptomyces]|uniref:Lipoprotein n=1 Tax=Streptomyces solicathayae TaxID=3081768 RepID=A0ABZ0LSB0_9ACTN|nr:hypothetical protein [Streptomyces sp. HUAS YS2]WOX22368.1 hypothetical protein R2D22_13565 [Streptomyces sp. HUAS YS2]
MKIIQRATAFGVGAALALALTGCGGTDDEGAKATVPEGWSELTTKGVDVAYPPAFKPQSDAERSDYNAAAATLTEGDRRVGIITVQLNFTTAHSAEQAAIAAEAGVQLGSKVQPTKKVEIAGTDDARRIDFEFVSVGDKGQPVRGAKIHGTIVTGLDSKDKTFAIRVDAQQGKISDDELAKIVASIEVH